MDSRLLTKRQYNAAIGAVILWGLQLNIVTCIVLMDTVVNLPMFPVLISCIVVSILGVLLTRLSRHPAVCFIGYSVLCLPVGVLLSSVLYMILHTDPWIIIYAVGITMLIVAVMIFASILFPGFFAKIGGILFAALIGLLVASVIFSFIGRPPVFSFISAIVFSLYIGYDFWKSQQYPKTIRNVILCALDIYLDVINLFFDILDIVDILHD